MKHSFDIEIAKKYGIEIAILLDNIIFWTAKNKANKKHFYDGKYWTYNSARAFTELFPYFNQIKIKRLLQSMKEENLIYVGNFNKNSYDRTKVCIRKKKEKDKYQKHKRKNYMTLELNIWQEQYKDIQTR